MIHDLIHAVHLLHGHHEVVVQAHGGIGLEGQIVFHRILVQHGGGDIRVGMPFGHVRHQAANGGLGHIVVLKDQRAAHAAADAGIALEIFQIAELVVLHFLQHADHVGDPVHGETAAGADRVGLAVAGGPGHAVGRRGNKVRIVLHGLDVRQQQAVDVHDGNRAVQGGLGLPDRPADRGHLGRAGGDEEAADVLRRAVVRHAEAPSRDRGRHLHRLPDVDDMLEQLRKAHLNQAHHRGTGR